MDDKQAGSAVADGERGLWLHFDLIDQRTRTVIAQLDLPDAAKQILQEADDGPHLETVEGGIAGALADLRYDNEAETIGETALVHFAVTADLLVTARRHPLQTGQRLSEAPTGGTAPEVFALLLRGLADTMGREVQRLAGELAKLEDGMLRSGGSETDRKVLAAIRRAVLRLERVFGPTAETLRDWAEDPDEEEVCPALRPPVAREQRRHTAVYHALSSLQERARIAQDELNALANEQTNRRLFVLSVLSATLLPASVISGIFGMNVGSVPGVDKPWGFAMGMALIVGSCGTVLGALRYWKLL